LTMRSNGAVVHTAGPFQGAEPDVLRAAVAAGAAYMDVCDDSDYAAACRALGPAARAAGVGAVTTCGIYPGVSSVMAAALVRRMRRDGAPPGDVRFSYFTAGAPPWPRLTGVKS
jgi:saccharopine dehydrogenase-like NADP-dependent oxidoreductase